ncbi:hypothetical protein [Streptomyces decoyicus]|uniref:hypothetical protein n=1 Tax=Streptomyces decoyicus TaxID=249567 RepID=UPI0033B5C2BB
MPCTAFYVNNVGRGRRQNLNEAQLREAILHGDLDDQHRPHFSGPAAELLPSGHVLTMPS